MVAELIEHHLLPHNRRAMPVVDDGRLVGIVTLSDIRQVPPEERAVTPVGRVMGGRDGLVTVAPRATLADALEALGRGDYEQVPVVDGGRLVGMLTRADVLRQFQLRSELGLASADAGSQSGPAAGAGAPSAGGGPGATEEGPTA